MSFTGEYVRAFLQEDFVTNKVVKILGLMNHIYQPSKLIHACERCY